jgi:hypothetical protein
MKAFVARNHNGILVASHVDLGNLMEEALFYKESTGNQITVSEEEFETAPKRNIYG